MTHQGHQTYIVQVTSNPGVDYEVDRAERDQLEELGLLVNAPADGDPTVLDTEVEAVVSDTGSSTRATLDTLYGAGGDHGALGGLGDDDHPQYALADGTRGDFAATGHNHDGSYAPTSHSHTAADLPSASTTGAGVVELATSAETTTGTDATRAATPAGVKAVADGKADAGHNHDADYAAAAHTHGTGDLTATGTADATTFLRGDNTWAVPSGGGGSSDHGSLTGLADDDHAQYALADGTRGDFAPTSHSHTAGDLPAASTTGAGVVELATTAETTTGTDTARAATPAGVKAVADTKADSSHSHTAGDLPSASTSASGVVELATTSETTTGTDSTRAVTPAGVKAVADTKADSGHNHDGSYATTGHNHDGDYLGVVAGSGLTDADVVTQAEYDGLATPRPSGRVYFIVG